MKIKIIASVATLLFTSVPWLVAQQGGTLRENSRNATDISNADRNFFHRAATSGKKEVAVSQAVLPNLKSAEVRQFAEKMVTDHTAANQQLQSVAEKKGVTLPEAEKSVTGKWGDAKGDDLDQRYVAEMVSDHEDAVALFRKAEGSNDPDVAAFARETRPKLERHLMMAQKLSKVAGVASSQN